eukprot:c45387_g1_i1.p1 GENE.c45387_g1_i1~~c45387_g1_i1.p1  ORF type:complete len:170 (+),score=28.58 c45387_g1_i1:1-510(+)
MGSLFAIVFAPMHLVVDDVAFAATFAGTAVLYFKMLLTLSIQGKKKIVAGTRPPEDAAIFKSKQGFDTVPVDEKSRRKIHEAERWTRIVQNDLEQILPGLFVAWASVLVTEYPLIHAGLVFSFVASRIFHTISYAKQLQPHRALAWLFAILSVLGMLICGSIGLLSRWK